MLNVNVWDLAFTIINIVILYLFMRHFLIGPVRKILAERKRIIEQDLDDAKNTRTEAEQMKVQYEVSMKEAKSEASQLIEDAKSKAGNEYDRILTQAREDALKKMEDAEKTIALEREKAMNDLKASVAGLAMAAAAKLLSEQSGPENDQELYNRFLAESGERND